ncbi:HlyD family secretion protein [Dyella sp. C9]|uniref:HlyD family secretion protein n=1 Tax=Dyella sp. C9 TaxID=2202154 RepID=UPI000DEFA42D|nr:HlyD family secretion protein [Dyella sp. C9]
MLNRHTRLAVIRDASAWAGKRPLQVLASLGGVALVLIGTFYLWAVARYRESTDDAYVRADIVTVSPRVAGYLTDVRVRDNQEVKAGDLLARVDDSDYLARVELARAAVAAATADVQGRDAALANLAAQADEQTSRIRAAEADVATGEAAARKATLNYARQQQLHHEQISSDQQLESAEADATSSTSANAATQAALAATQKRLVTLQTERTQAEAARKTAQAGLAKAQAALRLADIELEHTRIIAPVSGQVGQRSLRPGQFVAVGTPLLAIVPHDSYVVANYKETQLARVRQGQPVTIEVDALGGRTLHGHVDSFSPASGAEFALLPPDNATGNFTKIVQRMPLRIAIDADTALLRPGMSVVTTIDTHAASAP